MKSKVITVLGEVASEEMGITDAHNHIWISPVKCDMSNPPVLNQHEAILEELKDYKDIGGGGQIDCQPYGCGRDANKLRSLSEKSGVKVVAATGFHLQRYYPPDSDVWRIDIEEASSFFLSEISQGLIETRDQREVVYPGFIKIAVNKSIQKSSTYLIEAAVAASKESGLAIEMHTEKGQHIEDFINFIDQLGLQPQKLIICHIDKRPDHGLHKELAQAGYMLEYDTFFRPKYEPEKNLWPLIRSMVNNGLSHSIALATDLADSVMWTQIGGGPGLTGYINLVIARLREMDLDENVIQFLAGGNIASCLAVNK
jgi:5-phospho-D-xylono-1,4-lactonase